MSASAQYAFATLVTTDHYLPGALVVAAALRGVHPSPPSSPDELDPSEFHTVCLVTPESIHVSTMKLLRRAFDVVIGVEIIEEDTEEGLKLLGRPDLRSVLTKLHVLRLTDYRKVIFLDADVLPLRPLSHLFRLSSDFAAVPDIGWPDVFNSGFLVLNPGADKFDDVMSVVKSKGSWDGGDQGVLNEWRKNDWERLSFTYNTMPTATYTYAPAYKRFGSQIRNVHFIGPNKPWTQIPSRAPFAPSTGTVPLESPGDFAPPPSYGYPALVDRWFTVFDGHYRSPSAGSAFAAVATPSTAAGPGTTAEPQRYESVWRSEKLSEVKTEASAVPLGLEELRRLTIEGSGATRATEDEGVYRTMPLAGRIDLMRPKKSVVPPPLQEELGAATTKMRTPPPTFKIQIPDEPQTPTRSPPVPMTTLPTPAPHEIPPAPVLRGHSLPPETPTHFRGPISPESPSRDTSSLHPTVPQRDARPPSPPLIAWNPAVEAPPRTPPPATHFPQHTYITNVWDAPPQMERYREDGSGFFPLQPPPDIPEQLVKEGHYKAVIGESPEREHKRQILSEKRQNEIQEAHQQQPHHHHHQQQDVRAQRHRHAAAAPHPPPTPPPPRPDRSKVGTVFPWEESPRFAPQRYFPPTDSPPPGLPFKQPSPRALNLDVQVQAAAAAAGASPVTSPPPLPLPPHVAGFSRTTTYANAWDAMPSIQRYASRLVSPAPAPALPAWGVLRGAGRARKGSAATAAGEYYPQHATHPHQHHQHHQHHQSWEERVEASSRDADDEDEGEEEDEGRGRGRDPGGAGWSDRGGSGDGERDAAARGRTRTTRTTRTFSSAAVQTVPREVKHQGVQVPNGTLAVDDGGAPLSSVVRPDLDLLDPFRGAAQRQQPAAAASDHTRKQSPTAISFPPAQGGTRTVSQAQPLLVAEIPTAAVSTTTDSASTPQLQQQQQQQQQQISSSPSSSVGPVSPSDGSPLQRATAAAITAAAAARRPAGRTFDPARGVDVFKKGSEEVLARFLRMDSWDHHDDAGGGGGGGGGSLKHQQSNSATII